MVTACSFLLVALKVKVETYTRKNSTLSLLFRKKSATAVTLALREPNAHCLEYELTSTNSSISDFDVKSLPSSVVRYLLITIAQSIHYIARALTMTAHDMLPHNLSPNHRLEL